MYLRICLIHRAIHPRATMVDGPSHALCASLAHRARPHGGVPVGALLVRIEQAERARRATELAAAGGKRMPIYVCGAPGCSDHLLLLLPPAAAAVFDDGALTPDLAELISSGAVRHLPGVRRHERALEGPLPIQAPEPLRGCRFTFAEVFAGIGGFRLGLEQLGGQCTFACELDRLTVGTYRHHWAGDASTMLYEGDIVGVPADELPPFDVLTAGFPCQTFSARGEQLGCDVSAADWRGALFLELVRILRAASPRAFLFENVVGLVLMGGGEREAATADAPTRFVAGSVLRSMLQAFGACGYDVSWRVLNARHWLPQQRERLFIAGLRTELRAPPVDWEGLTCGARTDGAAPSGRPPAGGVICDVLEDPDCAEVGEAELSEAQWGTVQRQMASRGETLADRCLPLAGKAPTLIGSCRKLTNFTNKFVCHEADGTPRDGVAPRRRPRFLTARECARLMGFPDDFTLPPGRQGRSGVYKQLGNAVCPPVVRAVAERLLRSLEAAPPRPRPAPHSHDPRANAGAALTPD